MIINLSPHQERIVRDELESGHFRSMEEVIDEALAALRAKEQSSVDRGISGAQREAVRDMLAFLEKNRVRLEGVTTRELIREGRHL